LGGPTSHAVSGQTLRLHTTSLWYEDPLGLNGCPFRTAPNGQKGPPILSNDSNNAGRLGPLRIRAPQKFVAGIALVGICAFVLWAVDDLSEGTIQLMGAAMFPRVLGILLGISGVILVADSLLRDGEGLEKLALRGPVLVTAGIILFALTIRTLGLAVAGTLALVVSGFATEEARPAEVAIFAAAITFGCIILFRYLLGMAVPVLIIPGTSINF
jgi:putative tricarboxylic transport membrane protein